MRRQTSSGRCSGVSRLTHQSKTCSFKVGKDLFNDILVLKIDRQMTLQCLWSWRAASVFDQSWNRCVGKLRADAVWPFLARFTKAKHARLEQKMIFTRTSWCWKSTHKWRSSDRPNLLAETGNRLTSPWRVNHDTLSLGFSASLRQPRKKTTGQVAAASQSIACSPRVRPCSPRVRKGLFLCKEKTLRDEMGVIVIVDTRANYTAKLDRQKTSRKCWNWVMKRLYQKHGNFVTFLFYAKCDRVNHCVYLSLSLQVCSVFWFAWKWRLALA